MDEATWQGVDLVQQDLIYGPRIRTQPRRPSLLMKPRISKSEFLWVVGSEVPTKPPKGLLGKQPCLLRINDG